jgi:hypothetical protein
MTQPILVITDSRAKNCLSGYISEILDTEGIVCRDTVDLAKRPLEEGLLAGRDIVILADVGPDAKVQGMLTEYVASGGNLIASRPPLEMLKVFGLKPGAGVVKLFAEGYVTFDLNSSLAAGLQAESLQFHGEANLCEPGGAQILGFIAGKLGVRTHYPAITVHEYGKGRAAAFAFDLAASTVLFHQGTPLNSSTGPNPDPDRDLAYKPSDLVYRYLDERLKTLPQADIYQDLLVRIIEWMAERNKPLPRLWHFPNAAPAVALLDGDSDSMPSADFEKVIELVESVGGKYTLYLMTNDFKALSGAQGAKLLDRGHDFGPHLFAGRMPSLEEARASIRKEVMGFRERYGYSPVAHRGHSCIWVGWTEHAKYLYENGIRLDGNVYPGAGYQYGYCNASGLPVRFMDETGAIVDVYEQATLSSEDMLLTDKSLLPAMTVDEATRLSITQIDEAAEKYHGVYHPCFHPVYVRSKTKCSAPWIDAVAQHIRQRGLPFMNGREWVDFNDARREVRIEGISWNAASGKLDLRVKAPRAISGLTILLTPLPRGAPLRRDSEASGEGGAPGAKKGKTTNAQCVKLEGREQLAVILGAPRATGEEACISVE